MNEQMYLASLVRRWQVEGRWVDRGRWVRTKRGALIYSPSKSEIAMKCRLLRSIKGWHGAHARAPRGGEFGLATTAGLK